MLNKILTLVVLCVANAFGGYIFTMENDCFLKDDNNYSHGTEMEYVFDDLSYDSSGPYRVAYGANQLMYSPQNITLTSMPPQTDHPWCGTLSVFRETWSKSWFDEEVRNRIDFGILGPDAHSE